MSTSKIRLAAAALVIFTLAPAALAADSTSCTIFCQKASDCSFYGVKNVAAATAAECETASENNADCKDGDFTGFVFSSTCTETGTQNTFQGVSGTCGFSKIPTVSEWGLIALSLLLLGGAGFILGRRG